jgi:hypothetical protein
MVANAKSWLPMQQNLWLFVNGCKYKNTISTLTEFLNSSHNETSALTGPGKMITPHWTK